MCSISIFPTRSIDGIKLAEMFCSFFKHKGLSDNNISIRYRGDKSSRENLKSARAFLSSCLSDDLVIFDATRESNGDNNFDIANEWPKTLDHVIIISRNYLPINFYGTRDGGYPNYLMETMSNDDIFSWFTREFPKLDIPRKTEKGFLKIISSTGKYIEKRYQERNERTNIFISFRTKYQSKDKEGFPFDYRFSVEELSFRITKGIYHDGEIKTAQFLENGNLVYDSEMLTEQRRWQLLNIIDNDYILNCDEMWIYGSEDYLNSWWTRGELVVFSFLFFRKIDKRKGKTERKLRIYNPKEDKVFDIPKSKFVFLNENHLNKMTRIYSNCNPNTMGYESIKIIKNKYAYHFNQEAIQLDIFSKVSNFLKKNIVEKYIMPENYLNDRIFEDRFWNNLLYAETMNCTVLDRLSDIDCNFDVDKFFLLTEPAHIPVVNIDFDRQTATLASGREIKIKVKNSRFIWMANRMGKDVSVTQHNLEELKTILVDY